MEMYVNDSYACTWSCTIRYSLAFRAVSYLSNGFPLPFGAVQIMINSSSSSFGLPENINNSTEKGDQRVIFRDRRANTSNKTFRRCQKYTYFFFKKIRSSENNMFGDSKNGRPSPEKCHRRDYNSGKDQLP